MKTNQTCKVLCSKGSERNEPAMTDADIALFVKRIGDDYNVNWMVDNLPAAATGLLEDGSKLYARGIPVGAVERDTGNFFIYNHHKFTILYHEDPAYEGARVVGFEVFPMSVSQGKEISKECDASTGMKKGQPHMLVSGASAKAPMLITYSYDVFWVPSDIKWASRWDIYLSMGNLYSDNVHWFSIANSVIIAVFLMGLIAMIMVRALRIDIQKYNRVPTEEEKAEELEEKGWKLVHGDVFRPPTVLPMTFAVCVGIGSQLICMTLSTIVFAAIGFLSPANRGSLMIALLLLFLLFGIVAGYSTARTHKAFGGTAWQRVTLTTALAFPGFIFSVLLILNSAISTTGSANAVSAASMVTVLSLWLLLSVPLVFAGAYYGFKADKIDFPTRVASLPRQIPPQPWYLVTPLAMVLGGILPFGTVFVELFFILTSLWMDQYYYVFGFLLLVWVLLIVTCAEVSVVLTYFTLCAEDYRWWWRSMLVPATSGCYLYGYCIHYFLTNLNMPGTVPQLLYFSYMGLVALVFSFVTGTAGYLASLAFTRTIYAQVRVD
jgi:transmembrane 9 superfamily protein 2/4